MKYIVYRTHGNFKTQEVIHQVLNVSRSGILLDEMRKRCEIMKRLGEAKTHVLVKNEEFGMITNILKTFPFGVCDGDLIEVIDEILEAGEPPAALLPKKKEKKDADNPVDS